MQLHHATAAAILAGAVVLSSSASAATLTFEVTLDFRREAHYAYVDGVEVLNSIVSSSPSITFVQKYHFAEVDVQSVNGPLVGGLPTRQHQLYAALLGGSSTSPVAAEMLAYTIGPLDPTMEIHSGLLETIAPGARHRSQEMRVYDYPQHHEESVSGGRLHVFNTAWITDFGGNVDVPSSEAVTPTNYFDAMIGQTFFYSSRAQTEDYSAIVGVSRTLTGTFDWLEYTGTARLVSAVVPEPSTWALTILGFGGIGARLRRTRYHDRQPPARTAI